MVIARGEKSKRVSSLSTNDILSLRSSLEGSVAPHKAMLKGVGQLCLKKGQLSHGNKTNNQSYPEMQKIISCGTVDWKKVGGPCSLFPVWLGMKGRVRMESVVWDEKRQEFVDMNQKEVLRPAWEPDAAVLACRECQELFSMFSRRVRALFLRSRSSPLTMGEASLQALWAGVLQ